MKKIIIITFVLLSSFSCYSAGIIDTISIKKMYKEIDSIMEFDLDVSLIKLDVLDSILEATPFPDMQWKTKVLRANILKYFDKYDESLQLYYSADSIVSEIGDLKSKLNVKINIAATKEHLGLLEEALDTYKSTIEITKDTSLHLQEQLAFTYYNMGCLYKKKNNDSLALVSFISGIKEAKMSNSTRILGALHYSCAVIYKTNQNYESAIEECKMSADAYGEGHIELMRIYDVWGKCLQYLGRTDEAIVKLNMIIDNDKSTPLNLIYGYNSLSILHKEKEEYEKSIQCIKDAIDICEKNDLKNKKYGELMANLGATYFDMGQFKPALNYYILSKPYLIDSLNNNVANKSYLMESLVLTRSYLKEDQDLISDFEEFIKYNDENIDKVRDKIDVELLAKYKSELKEAENSKLEAQKELNEATIDKQKKYLVGGGLGLGIISVLSFFLFRQRNAQKELNLNIANQRDQIKVLNRELNHRVKNNLAFITSLLEMEKRRVGSEEAKIALTDSETRLRTLSLMHTNLFKNNSDTNVDLAQYLKEVIISLQDIFELPSKELIVDFEFIAYTMDAEDAIRIGLIVNELFTNSIKHAFSKIDVPNIVIETKLNRDKKLILRYRDNGPGISEQVLSDSKPDSMGQKLIGLLHKQVKGVCDLQIG